MSGILTHLSRAQGLTLIYTMIVGKIGTNDLTTANDLLDLCKHAIEDTGPDHRYALQAGLIKGDQSALVAVGIALLQAGAQEG